MSYFVMEKLKDLNEQDGIWYQFRITYNSKNYVVAIKFVNDNYQEKLTDKIKETLDIIEFEGVKVSEPIRIIV